jgi:hypothetical protein
MTHLNAVDQNSIWGAGHCPGRLLKSPSLPVTREPAQVAQSVEQRTENPRVGGSIPPLGTIVFNGLATIEQPQKLLKARQSFVSDC